MRRGIGAHAAQPEKVIVREPVGNAVAINGYCAVVEHAVRRGDHRAGAKTELASLAHPLLTIVEHGLGVGKGSLARLGDQRRRHPAGYRPVGIDRKHGLGEILVETRTAQHPPAAAIDQRRSIRKRGNCRRRLPIGGKPASDPSQDLGLVGSAQSLPGYDDCAAGTLHDLYGAAAIPDSFDPGETAGLLVPAPRCELDPAVAGDGQREVNRPAEVQNRHWPDSRDFGAKIVPLTGSGNDKSCLSASKGRLKPAVDGTGTVKRRRDQRVGFGVAVLHEGKHYRRTWDREFESASLQRRVGRTRIVFARPAGGPRADRPCLVIPTTKVAVVYRARGDMA